MKKVKRLRHKFGAIKCEREGIKFPSQLEKNCFQELQQLKKNGKILFFLRQVPFDLPAKRIHRVDFCVFTEENVIFIEAKGRDLEVGKLKREQVECLFGIQIYVVKKPSQILEIISSVK